MIQVQPLFIADSNRSSLNRTLILATRHAQQPLPLYPEPLENAVLWQIAKLTECPDTPAVQQILHMLADRQRIQSQIREELRLLTRNNHRDSGEIACGEDRCFSRSRDSDVARQAP